MHRPELPRRFQSLRTLARLNVLAVAFSLASLVTAFFVSTKFSQHASYTALAFGLPTVLCAIVWMAFLRKGTIRGWLLSIPFAALNAGLTCAFMSVIDRIEDTPLVHPFAVDIVWGLVLGMTIGAIVWIPALLLTLLFFGVPIARAQSLAKKGLGGQERGERLVGIVTALLSALGLGVVVSKTELDLDGMSTWIGPVLGLLMGGSAAFLADRRTQRRHHFVRAVEAGEVEGFRIDHTDEGRVLMRVTSMGEGYRVANFEEPVYEDSPISERPQAARL